MGLIGIHTYYAQALLKAFRGAYFDEDAFKLCVVVTDGQIWKIGTRSAMLEFAARR